MQIPPRWLVRLAEFRQAWLPSGRGIESGPVENDRQTGLRGQAGLVGQAMVEFAIVSVAFFLILFGTIDFGRAIFLNSELHNAVRDAAREGKVGSANGYGVNTATLKTRIARGWNSETQQTYTRPGLEKATVTVTCVGSGGCVSGNTLVVSAALPFQAITQEFLGIGPLTLRASASVTLE